MGTCIPFHSNIAMKRYTRSSCHPLNAFFYNPTVSNYDFPPQSTITREWQRCGWMTINICIMIDLGQWDQLRKEMNEISV